MSKPRFRMKSKGSPKTSDTARAAQKANSQKPRTRALPEEKELRQLARLSMVDFLCTDALDRLKTIMRKKGKGSDNTFLLAFRLAADKFGLPTISEQTVNVEGGGPLIRFEFKGLPKPGSEQTK